MDDKEMIELAAKAAGIKYDEIRSKPHPKSGCFWGLWLTYDREPSEYDRRYWTPLTDDGDAFRLAVALQLDITFINGDVVVLNVSEGGGCDQYAQAREAIVRAAVQIGKAMP